MLFVSIIESLISSQSCSFGAGIRQIVQLTFFEYENENAKWQLW